jgi:hypothetical protein
VDCRQTLPRSNVNHMGQNLERGNVCLQSTLSVLYLGYLFSPHIFASYDLYPCGSQRSVDCKQTLPRSKVDHLNTIHRMQKYGGKTDNQFVPMWFTLERGNICLQSTLSVLYLGYLFSPIFLHPMIYIQVVHLRTW